MDNLSPEDREILAKTKFKQWFDECFAETFGSAFDGRLNEIASFGEGESQGKTAVTTSGKTASEGSKPKRRSLFEVAFSDTFGM